MTSKSQGWSTAMTLLVTVVASTLIMLALLLTHHDSADHNTDTVSALNSGIPGTTVTQSAAAAKSATNTDSAANTAAPPASSAPASGSGQSSEGSAAAGSPGSAATGTSPAPATNPATNTDTNPAASEKRLEQTVVNNDFEGTGAQIYVQACQSCHMKGGKGARGAGIYPALAGNPKLKSVQYVESMLLYGNGAMPSFGHYMSDQQISDIVNYVRTELNSNTDKVKPEDIKSARPKDPHYIIFGEAAG